MNFNHEVYLPESDRRIKWLRDTVAGRPVAILASGPSINELEQRINELSEYDICWFGFNTFIHEKCILSKINERYDIYMDACRENIPLTISDIKEYLIRPELNIFISTLYRNTFELVPCFNLTEALINYGYRMLFFYLASTHDVPSKENPLHFIQGNSLQMAIQISIISGASRIVLFGADGGSPDYLNRYYRQDSYNGPVPVVEKIRQDTFNHFNPVMPASINNTCITYNLEEPLILNASPQSLYTPFQKCSYDAALKILKTCRRE